jgi:hypothetical protein
MQSMSDFTQCEARCVYLLSAAAVAALTDSNALLLSVYNLCAGEQSR